MPPKQKKKALKKPVNRGFATTSIPKKVVEPEPSLDDQDTAQDEHEAPDSLQALAGPNAKVESDAKRHGIDGEDADGSKDFIPAQDEWDLEAEDRELQSLAEKLRPVCEKEIGKQIKILEYDRRAAKSFGEFRWSDARLQGDILDLARSAQQATEESGLKPTVLNNGEDEEKLLQKIVVLYGVLEKFGYPPHRVEECLKAIKTIELEEAMDYLLLHCTNEELIMAGHDGLTGHEHASNNAERDTNPDTSVDDGDTSFALSNLSLDDDLTMSIRSQLSPFALTPTNPPSRRCSADVPSAEIKEKILLYSKHQSESTGSESSAIENYVALKLAMIELSKKIPRLGTSHLKGKALKDAAKYRKELKTIEDKVKLVQAGYTFNQREADQALKTKLKEAKLPKTGDSSLPEENDASIVAEEGSLTTTRPSPTVPSPLPVTAFQSGDNDDGQDDDSFEIIQPDEALEPIESCSQAAETSQILLWAPGSSEAIPARTPQSEDEGPSIDMANEEGTSMFGATFNLVQHTESTLDPNQSTGTDSKDRVFTSTTVVVRDMPLPRQFNGKTPQSLLEDSIKRLDKYVQPRYFVISGGSRAVKASVEIKWQNHKMIAEHGGSVNGNPSSHTHNAVQTFTMEEEACHDENQAYNYVATVALFYLHSHNPSTVHRSLPTLFRELWDELEEKRKRDDDRRYLEHLKTLMSIVKTRLAPANVLGAEDLSTSKPPKISGGLMVPANEPTTSNASHGVWSEYSDITLMEEFAMRQQWPTYQYMLRYRASLPIAVYRSIIVTAIDQNQVVVLCGETGCGKSTQLPAFILEHELSQGRAVKIFCTEPRRISAISLAQRVSQELGEPTGAVGQMGSLVGYNIRLESKISPTTRLVYATTGVVLRMLENGTDLHEITHLIIDEVHERSIDSDFLLIALRTILERRPNLRLILMSATVDAEKISSYMNGCPILKVPGRTFPVTSFFLEDVIELTGYWLDKRSDSPYLARQIKRKVVTLKTFDADDEIPTLDDDDDVAAMDASRLAHTYAKSTREVLELLDEHQINMDLIILLLEQICLLNPSLVERFSNAILVFLPSLDTIRKLTELLESHHIFGTTAFQIFPLHSTISNENQGLVFQTPPPGVRKIVISTNIAETGITIPDVTCVIDSGKHREMRYDEKRQISRLVETFIAKSNATQRKGRAGRVQEGICFHLFTKHRMDTQLAENPLPEMLRLSLQDLALRIKIMKIGASIEDVLLQALDPPATVNVQRAIASLVEVKALTPNEEITPLGRHLVKLPMDVHMGKLLILGCLFRCLSPALTVAAALNSKSPFLTPFGREQEADAIKRSFKVENSDFLTICNVYNTWRDACRNDHAHQFCRKNMLSLQNLMQIEELRVQFFGHLVDSGFINFKDSGTRHNHSRSKFCSVPSAFDTNAHDAKIVMGCVGAAMFPKLLIRDSSGPNTNGYAHQTQGAWRTMTNSAPAAIHPSSVNFTSGRRPDFGDAKYVTYFNIMQSKKLYVWESGVLDEKAMFLLCGEADFKLPAQSVILDRKIKASVNPKTLLALKLLRHRFQLLFNQKMKNPSKALSENQQRWFDLVIAAIKDEKEPGGMISGQKDETGRLLNAEPIKKKTMSVVLTRAGQGPKRPATTENGGVPSPPLITTENRKLSVEEEEPATARVEPGMILYDSEGTGVYDHEEGSYAEGEGNRHTYDPRGTSASVVGDVNPNVVGTTTATRLNPNAPVWYNMG